MGFWSKLFGAKPAPSRTETPAANDGSTRITDGAKKSREARFVDWCMAEIREHPSVERAEPLEGPGLPVAIWTSDGQQKLFLGNTFLETRDASPEQRLTALRRLLSSIDDVGKERDWDDAAPALVPLLRASTFGVMADAPLTMVRSPFVPFLSSFVGVDDAERIAFATVNQLEAWGQTPEAALTRAFANFELHLSTATDEHPDSALYDAEAPYPIWHVTRDDSYESSRLTLPGYLARFRGKVAGNPIAIVPHRSMLVIAGDGNPLALARLAQMAEREFNASPRRISPAIYTVSDSGQVVPLHLPTDHPHHDLIERGHYLLAHDVYAEQKAQLEQRFDQEGLDVFVASYLLAANKQTGKLSSMSTMTENVASLLPETDELALVSRTESRPPLVVPRAAAAALVPECFEAAPEHDPPRIRTRGWPSPAKLAELERLATKR